MLSLVIAAFVGSGGLTYAATASLSFTTTIESGSMVETASYVVFRDGSTYFAKNGTTGAIDYSGTNASLLIQQTIDALSYGRIFFEPATYVMNSYITLTSNIEFCGVFGKTILEGDTINDISMVRIVDGTENVTVKGITINSASYFYNGLVVFNETSNILITECAFLNGYDRNLWIWNASNIIVTDSFIYKREPVAGRPSIDLNDPSLDISRSEHVIIENCILEGDLNTPAGAEYPLVLLWSSDLTNTDVTITNSHFKNHEFDFLRIVGTENSKVIGNTFNNASWHAITTQDYGSYGITISSNTIIHNYRNGFYFFYLYDSSVIGNTILDVNQANSQWDGIILRDCSNVTVDANIIANDATYSAYRGIDLLNSTYCIISNNLVRNCTSSGILERGASSDYNIIIGCMALDNASPNITIVGSNTKVNLCYNGTNWIS